MRARNTCHAKNSMPWPSWAKQSRFLNNINKKLKKGANIFIVVNDKYNLYEKIGEAVGFDLVDVFIRPVTMRTERNGKDFLNL